MVNGRAHNLARLSEIAALKRDAESQDLAKLNVEIQSLQMQVARLRKVLRLRGRDLELDPSRLSGADVHWVRRTEVQIGELQTQIAKLYGRRELLMQAARTAVGRAQAIDSLVNRLSVKPTRWD